MAEIIASISSKFQQHHVEALFLKSSWHKFLWISKKVHYGHFWKCSFAQNLWELNRWRTNWVVLSVIKDNVLPLSQREQNIKILWSCLLTIIKSFMVCVSRFHFIILSCTHVSFFDSWDHQINVVLQKWS